MAENKDYTEIEVSENSYDYDEYNPAEIVNKDRFSEPDEEIGLLSPFLLNKSTTSKEKKVIFTKNKIHVFDIPTKYREKSVSDFATGNLDDFFYRCDTEIWEIMALIQDYDRRNNVPLSHLHNFLHDIMLGDITLSKSKDFALLKQFRKTSAEQISRSENINYQKAQEEKKKWGFLPGRE